jgi:ATP/maltotriose-dependent transcriptional regulator MalT
MDLLPATIATARGYIAAATGDMAGVFQHTEDALMWIPSDQHMKRGLASMMLAVAHWGMGELSEAETIIVKSLDDVERGGNPLAYKSVSMALGEVYIQQGRLSEARELFNALISSVKNENHFSILLASLYLALAKVAFLLGDKQHAYSLLEESKAHGQRCALVDWQYKYYLLLARVYCSEGFLDLARDCLRESRAHYAMNPLPDDVSFEDMAAMIKQAEAGNLINQPSRDAGAKSQLLTREYANQGLLESLTVRELEVLALIASGLSNQEIGNTLFLALSTVKGYNQTIYGKLQVKRRTEAVIKAKTPGLGLDQTLLYFKSEPYL